MNSRKYCALAVSICVALTTIAVFAAFDSAHAKSFTFCNRIGEPVGLAVGYDRAGTSESTSEGWHKVAACACKQVFDVELRATEIFILVLKQNEFSVLSGGKGPLCITHPKGFRFVNQNKSQASCQQAGGKWVNFQFVDITHQDQIEFRVPGGKPCNL